MRSTEKCFCYLPFLTFLVTVQSLIYTQCCHFPHVCLLPVNSGFLFNSSQSVLSTYTNKYLFTICSQLCIFCVWVDVMFLFIHNIWIGLCFLSGNFSVVFFSLFCGYFILMSLWLVPYLFVFLWVYFVCLCLFPTLPVIKGL